MPFSELLGQSTAIETLQRAVCSERLHHAYRFVGPEGVGKELAARLLARALLCPVGEGSPCRVCSTCKRVMETAEQAPHVPLHPDVVLVGRGLYSGTLLTQKETNGISVEQIRRVVLDRARYGPHEARRLVFIVRDADELTTASANALLKTLEEPRADVNFILLTHLPQRLLDTILSRTQAVRFGPLPLNTVERILESQGVSTRVARLANGSAGRALRLTTDDGLEQLEQFVGALDAAFDFKDMSLGLELASQLPKDRRQVREWLEGYGSHISQVASQDPEAPVVELLLRRFSLIGRALLALEANASPALVLEGLLAEAR